MEVPKLFRILVHFLMIFVQIHSESDLRGCRFTYDQSPDVQLVVKQFEAAMIVCKSPKQNCEEMITVSLYKNNTILGQLSEKVRKIEYKYKIKSVQMIHSGIYLCTFQSKYDSFNTTITVNISDGFPNIDLSLPENSDLIKPNQLYLGRDMKNSLVVRHHIAGSSCQLECQFYSPQNNVSVYAYWIKHYEKFNYSSGTFLSSSPRFNIIQHESCDDFENGDLQCINTKLKISDIISTDHAFFTCLLEADNKTIKNVHFTFSLMVDATVKMYRNDKSRTYLPPLEFSINSTVCYGQNFSFFCAADDSYLKMYLYKVNPSTDLSRNTLYMNDSVPLKVRLPYSVELSSLNEKDQRLIYNNLRTTYINYTLISVTDNDTGRYVCIIEDHLAFSNNWKSMYLSVEMCNMFGFFVSLTTKYVFLIISICLISLLFICILIIIYCKRKYYKISRFPIRKMIIIEYESPIYKSFFNDTKDNKTDSVHSNNILPDSNPILAPIIKIKPIKGSLQHFRRRSYGEQLPSTSTDRTHLESTRFSSQLDNEVFECNNFDYNSKIKSEIRKSSLVLFDSMYEFPNDRRWEFSREKLKITSQKLGEGAFGMVYEGLATDICGRCGVTKVGVKMMKDDFSDSNVFDFVKEIETMKQIGRHRHVIQLLGVCTQNGPLRVIVELAPYGNLRDYLRSKGFKSCKSSKYPSTLSRSILCIYSLQIARGMTYLSSKSVVHRDLSARNILVGENYDMKIADFGLTRIVDYYYRKKTDGILPVKWMAPEALLEKKYTTKSDVWSYGILLWEIFSLGESPYSSILPENVIDIIKRGIQNPQPLMANVEIYRLMQQCWNIYTENRPHFYQIVEILREILLRVSDEPEQNIYHSETHYLDMEAEYLEPKESSP